MSITFTWNNPNTELYTPEETVIYRDTIPFEADDLPEEYDSFPNVVTTFTDSGAVDGTKYYYRIGFKLGVKEEVSRLIEITAPTEPNLFTTAIVNDGVSAYGEYSTYDYAKQYAVYDDWLNFISPVMAGSPYFSGISEYGTGSRDNMIYRLAAMAAIQRFKRSVWLVEQFTMSDQSAYFTFLTSGSGADRYNASVQSGIANGSKLTWKEAFDILGRASGCVDIILNVFTELRAAIAQTLTSLRGTAVSNVTHLWAMRMWIQNINQLGGYYNNAAPRGVMLPRPNGGAAIAPGGRSVGDEPEFDAMPRVIRAILMTYPEIADAIAINDQRNSLTYTTAADAVVDWLGESNNHYIKVDPLNNFLQDSGYTVAGTPQSPRRLGYNGQINVPVGMIGMAGLPLDQAAIGNATSFFFKTPTLNGKDFVVSSLMQGSGQRGMMHMGQLWNRASSELESYTDGLSTTDPLESQVALRWIPHLDLTDQSAFGTTLTCLNSELIANHLSAEAVNAGFPDAAFALRGSAATTFGTIRTDLDMIARARSGTSWTIEMFVTDKRQLSPTSGNVTSLLSLGNIASGQRWFQLGHYPYYYGAFAPFIASSPTSSYGAVGAVGGHLMLQKTATRDNYGCGNSRFHIAVQYDAIASELRVFVNGCLIYIWSGTPAVTALSYLCFFGMLNSNSDLTTSRQNAAAALAYGDLLVHEIVVTLAKRYNYDCFIGQVPFARKRFSV